MANPNSIFATKRTNSKHIGAVHCKMTGTLRRIIIPDKDEELEDPSHVLHENEVLIFHNKEEINHDISTKNLHKLAKDKHTHRFHESCIFSFEHHCVVVNEDGLVVNTVMASPHIDEIEGYTLILSKVGQIGDIWDGTNFIRDGVIVNG